MGPFSQLESFYQDEKQQRFEQIIGNSPALEAVFEEVQRVAPTSSTVLIQGETSTGNELIAKAIHNISPRDGRPFVKVNCAAIPCDLLERELFGHQKGALTGAIAQRPGRFELANQGTLFLDQVGDIPLCLHPKLFAGFAGAGVRATRKRSHAPRRRAGSGRHSPQSGANG